ncbi:beta-ketoacyl-ACP synthase III [Kitasatospora sp. NPDC059646]|uniref:beta-ketoacyl-ACP synthase III n=1 Tax=Kitasatospora sp. NPDC059646 TaxID=3346893 RepID=UPI003679DC4C
MTAELGHHPELRHSRILGTGSFRPPRVVGNAEICEHIDSSEEWILARSGIRTRRFAAPDETLAVMASAAGAAALADAGLAPAEVDSVIVATMSHRLGTPSVAAEVASRLGIDSPGALDISAACSGFCYGTALAGDLVRAGSADHVLLIGAERMTDIVDPADRSAAFLFADGAGAVVVGPSATPGIGPVVWGSDGTQGDVIRMSHAGAPAGQEQSGAAPALRMQGPSVYRWAISEMGDIGRQAVKNAGLTMADIDVFVPHQANRRIVDALARSLDLREDAVVARDVTDSGNTSAASVPLALDRLRSEGSAGSGDLALLIGFGAGLAYAAQVVRLP